MNINPDLLLPCEELAAREVAIFELATVKAALGETGALARAYLKVAAQMRNQLGLSAQAVDLYCVGRLSQIASKRLLNFGETVESLDDAGFLKTATAQIINLLKGQK